MRVLRTQALTSDDELRNNWHTSDEYKELEAKAKTDHGKSPYIPIPDQVAGT